MLGHLHSRTSARRSPLGEHGSRALAALVVCVLSLLPGSRARVPAAQNAGGGPEVSASHLYGVPEVMRFKDGKVGAFTMQLDDSMISQAEVAIPLLNERGLVATFFTNPGLERYQRNVQVWEQVCPSSGHELANHTWEHKGAQSMEEADQQIGDSSRLIWKLYPSRSKLLPFARGGGTEWVIDRDEITGLMRRYFLFRRPSQVSIAEESGTTEDVTSHPRRAIENGEWVPVHFHGIGSEWISTTREHFVELLDYLAANQDKLWVATCGDAYKYQQERDAVSRIALTDETESGFRIAVECDETKVETYGRPLAELYDQPLTIRHPVPDTWSRFEVRQGADVKTCEVVAGEGARYAQYDVRPGVAAAAVTRVE